MKTEIKKAWARRDRTAGFSLIELLIVVFVVMLIAAIVIPNVLLAVTPRGFPCDYSVPPACNTPAPKYFVYYLTDTRPGGSGWAAVVVTKAGRTKVVDWNGSAWK